MGAATRYILKAEIGPFLVVGGALTGVLWLTQGLRALDRVVVDGAGFLTFLRFSLLALPSLLPMALPLIVFCAVCYTYHRLSAESELVALAATGLGRRALLGPALLLGLGAAILAWGLNLWAGPLAARALRAEETALRAGLAAGLREGRFETLGPGITVHIRARGGDGELRGVLIQDDRDPGRRTTLIADRGLLLPGPRLVLLQGVSQQVGREREGLTTLAFDRYAFDFPPSARREDRLEPRERFLGSLLAPSGDERDRARLIAEGHHRLAAPLNAIALALLGALPFLDRGAGASRRGRVALSAVAALAVLAGSIGLLYLSARFQGVWPLQYALPIVVMVSAGCALVVRPGLRLPALAVR